MKRPSVTNIVTALILLSVGVAWGQSRGGSIQVVTVRDTLTAQAYSVRLTEMRVQRDGLRARLAGIGELQPTTIYVTDTLVSPPDTIIRFLRVDNRTQTLSIEFLMPDSVTVGLRPELHTGFDISGCDDGWAIQDGTVLCDRARLGHLSLIADIGTTSTLGTIWTPSYRSPWSVTIAHTGSKLNIGVRRAWRLW